jgi:hypothetical protein
VPVGVLSVDCNLHPPGHQADDAATRVEWETLLPASAPVQSQRHRPCDDVGGTDNGRGDCFFAWVNIMPPWHQPTTPLLNPHREARRRAARDAPAARHANQSQRTAENPSLLLLSLSVCRPRPRTSSGAIRVPLSCGPLTAAAETAAVAAQWPQCRLVAGCFERSAPPVAQSKACLGQAPRPIPPRAAKGRGCSPRPGCEAHAMEPYQSVEERSLGSLRAWALVECCPEPCQPSIRLWELLFCIETRPRVSAHPLSYIGCHGRRGARTHVLAISP